MICYDFNSVWLFGYCLAAHCAPSHGFVVISNRSFESGISEDYAIPPDALSQIDSTYLDASLPSLHMRTSYADSPYKKLEPMEKVRPAENYQQKQNIYEKNSCQFAISDWPFGETRWQAEDVAKALVHPEEWHTHLLEMPERH